MIIVHCNYNYYPIIISYKSDTLMISPQRVYRLVKVMFEVNILMCVYNKDGLNYFNTIMQSARRSC